MHHLKKNRPDWLLRIPCEASTLALQSSPHVCVKLCVPNYSSTAHTVLASSLMQHPSVQPSMPTKPFNILWRPYAYIHSHFICSTKCHSKCLFLPNKCIFIFVLFPSSPHSCIPHYAKENELQMQKLI